MRLVRAVRLCAGVGAMGRPGFFPFGRGDVAQLGERRLCKAEVVGSIPIVSTNFALARDVVWNGLVAQLVRARP